MHWIDGVARRLQVHSGANCLYRRGRMIEEWIARDTLATVLQSGRDPDDVARAQVFRGYTGGFAAPAPADALGRGDSGPRSDKHRQGCEAVLALIQAAWNERRFSAVGELMVRDLFLYSAGDTVHIRPHGYLAETLRLLGAFPNAQFEVRDVQANDNPRYAGLRVAVLWKMTAPTRAYRCSVRAPMRPATYWAYRSSSCRTGAWYASVGCTTRSHCEPRSMLPAVTSRAEATTSTSTDSSKTRRRNLIMAVRVVLQGFGAMGRACARTLLAREDADIVAVLDVAPNLVGRTVGEVLDAAGPAAGVRIAHPDDVHLSGLGADVAVHTTTAFLGPAEAQLTALVASGLDVVSICQELVFPLAHNRASAGRLDAAAREHGRSVVAAGVNPGWILDMLVVAATLGCATVDTVRATRVVDFSPYGPDEMAHIGAGLDPLSFEAGVRAGHIGHIGLLESAALVSTALGLDVDVWEQSKVPVLAQAPCSTPFASVGSGQVRGFRQTVSGRRGEATVLEMAMVGLLGRQADDEPWGDRLTITGSTSMDVTILGADTSAGGRATAEVAVNLIGPILAAEPGLHTVLDLPLVRSRASLRL